MTLFRSFLFLVLTTQIWGSEFINIPIPAGWDTESKESYLMRLPDNDYPNIALVSPDGKAHFSFHYKKDVDLARSPKEMLELIIERIKKKYENAIIEALIGDNLSGTAQVTFTNPDSTANHKTHIMTFGHDGKLVIVTWHLDKTAGTAVETIVKDHEASFVTILQNEKPDR